MIDSWPAHYAGEERRRLRRLAVRMLAVIVAFTVLTLTAPGALGVLVAGLLVWSPFLWSRASTLRRVERAQQWGKGTMRIETSGVGWGARAQARIALDAGEVLIRKVRKANGLVPTTDRHSAGIVGFERNRRRASIVLTSNETAWRHVD